MSVYYLSEIIHDGSADLGGHSLFALHDEPERAERLVSVPRAQAQQRGGDGRRPARDDCRPTIKAARRAKCDPTKANRLPGNRSKLRREHGPTVSNGRPAGNGIGSVES